MKKLIPLILLASQCNAAPLTDLMNSVEAATPLIHQLIDADESKILVHCGGDLDCVEGFKNDQKALADAMNLLEGVTTTYHANRATVVFNENLLFSK